MVHDVRCEISMWARQHSHQGPGYKYYSLWDSGPLGPSWVQYGSITHPPKSTKLQFHTYLCNPTSSPVGTFNKHGQGVFFLLWPLFARAPRHWFLETFLLSAPGVQSVIFCCAPLGAATFRRGQSKKKNTTQGVFFCSGPRERQGKEKPRAGTGPEQKKNATQVFFFAAAPAKGKGRRSLVGRRHGARAKKKKKHHPVCFFCSGPGERQGNEKPRWAPARGQSKKKHHPGWGGVFCFCSGPVPAPTRLLLPLPFAGAAAKKQNLGGVFFLLWSRAGTGLLLPLPFPGAGAKKKTPWVFFFCCCGPARTLTHSLRAWVAMPPPRRGGVFFFGCGPARTGVVFFFCCGPTRTLTHSLWAEAISARPGWCFFFFFLRPRLVSLDNNKKCLGYYIGSKKTRRGHSKKKHHFPTNINNPYNRNLGP